MAKRNGYVYVIKLDEHYKIGKTLNPKQRFGEYTLLYKKPQEVFIEYVKDYSKLEDELHKMFKEKRMRGEWFNLAKQDLSIIERILKSNSIEYFDEEIINPKIYLDLTNDKSTIIKLKTGRFVKVMDKEKEVMQKLVNFPSTYYALNVLKGYIQFNNNLIMKDGKKYKCIDLANEMGITRQMASVHLKRLKELNLIGEVPTNRGMYWAINPEYYRRGDEIPKIVKDTFEKKLKI